MTQERPSWRWRDAHRASADRVTTVEVFFDVVFVFTLTQLTRILEADLSLAGVGRILLLFGILWWMFDGYVWLPTRYRLRCRCRSCCCSRRWRDS